MAVPTKGVHRRRSMEIQASSTSSRAHDGRRRQLMQQPHSPCGRWTAVVMLVSLFMSCPNECADAFETFKTSSQTHRRNHIVGPFHTQGHASIPADKFRHLSWGGGASSSTLLNNDSGKNNQGFLIGTYQPSCRRDVHYEPSRRSPVRHWPWSVGDEVPYKTRSSSSSNPTYLSSRSMLRSSSSPVRRMPTVASQSARSSSALKATSSSSSPASLVLHAPNATEIPPKGNSNQTADNSSSDNDDVEEEDPGENDEEIVEFFSSTPSYDDSTQAVVSSVAPTTTVAPTHVKEHRLPPAQPQQPKEKSSPAPETPVKKRTLYDVLGAHPDETRIQLKKRYIALAKLSHPDAIGQRRVLDVGDGVESQELDFTEIAAAWRILADPKQRKRYDRSLKAEEFSENVQIWVGDLAKSASAWGRAAAPFFRKTTETVQAAMAASQSSWTPVSGSGIYADDDEKLNKTPSAVQEVKTTTTTTSSKKVTKTEITTTEEVVEMGNNLTTTTVTSTEAVGQSRNGDGAVDEEAVAKNTNGAAVVVGESTMVAQNEEAVGDTSSLDLLEKSELLTKRAIQESKEAARMKAELQRIIERRLRMSLHTPGSSLTSSEAYVILEEFNKTVSDAVSTWDRARMRTTVEHEIQALKREESAFVEAQVADTDAQTMFQSSVEGRLRALQNLHWATHTEERARQSWESAVERVGEAQNVLNESTRVLTQAEAQAKKSDYEMERRSLALERQSEKVRTALRNKEKQVRKEKGLRPAAPDCTYDEAENRLLMLAELRNEERLLAEMSNQLESTAERLLTRAHTLRERAEELDRRTHPK